MYLREEEDSKDRVYQESIEEIKCLKYIQPAESQPQSELNPIEFPSKNGYGIKIALYIGTVWRQKSEREICKRKIGKNCPTSQKMSQGCH